ncbi:MAG: tRNA threonylcarbamoyladenosine dehydratase [Chitinispirillales bacterium]|jgi:tRNA A37 threonylcarbamoyladenosine dehydratase|nr:tRNA threonylcarbamoyladenosine dehydratase [Chitinispirillales bacterium]
MQEGNFIFLVSSRPIKYILVGKSYDFYIKADKLPGKHPFSRLELLVGPERLKALAGARVIVFGVGGVGSWCAEGLVRSGVGTVTIVDFDDVCVTNINRQLQATSLSVGKSKVEEIVRRLREINPKAEIEGRHRIYNLETKREFDLGGYDYVIDAIDSLSSKVDLIMNASASGAAVFSSLGAACKVDPTRVRVSSIWKSDRCRLGKFVRKRLRRWGFKGDFLCVWSDEPEFCVDSGNDVSVEDIVDEDINANTNDAPTNKTINGSLVNVTAVFGFTLSGLVFQDIIKQARP